MDSTTVMDNRSKVSHERIDKFSFMPEEIVHEIMLLLPISDLTRMGVLSKVFQRSLRSFRVLDLDYDIFMLGNTSRRKDQAKELFNFVSDSIGSRSALLGDDALERVTFRGDIPGDIPESLFDPGHRYVSSAIESVANFALNRNAKELVFDFPSKSVPGLPGTVFRASSIRTMKLTGLSLDIPCQTLVLECPSLNDFSLDSCVTKGYWDWTVKFSTPKLKTAKLLRCERLREIVIDGPTAASLDSFSFVKSPDDDDITCEIVNLASCTSLKYLELGGISRTDEPWFGKSAEFLVFSVLEVLRLKDCLAATRVSAESRSLKTVELKGCKLVERVHVIAPNLEFFEHSLDAPVDEYEVRHCEIDIGQCKKLKDLRLRNVGNSDSVIRLGVNGTALSCRFLENLALEGCSSVEGIEFRSNHLKRIEILWCARLRKIAIDAPGLSSFVYSGPAFDSPPPLVNSRVNLDAELVLVYKKTDHGFQVLRNFISQFGHCKTLTLKTSSNQEGLFCFPTKVKERLVSPLYGLQHLHIKLPKEGLDIVKLVDNLLWIAPRAKTISITFGSQLIAILKLFFEPDDESVDDDEEDSSKCCYSLPIKCWRHYLIRVEVDAFEDSIRELDLFRYFSHSACYIFKLCL